MMLPKISVIVPVYNTGSLLLPCLDSLSAQTLPEIEFLLINDGSTDDSGAICDAYAARDVRFHVLHKKNAGVSRARNDGIRLARGEFIGFVDSDDTISPEMFQVLYELAQTNCTDIVICDSMAVGTGVPDTLETIPPLPESRLLKKEDVSPEILLELAGSACRCIYRREMLTDGEIFFPEDLKFSEDRIFNIRAMGAAQRMYYDKTVYYLRLLHNQSAVHKFYPNYFEIAKDATKRTEQAIRDFWNDDAAFQTAYLSQFIGASIAAINNYFYKTSAFSKREAFSMVRSLCKDPQLRDAVSKSGFGGIRGTWILKKRVWLLCGCAMYLNIKYGR